MRGIVYDGESTKLVDQLEVRSAGSREVVVEIVAAGMCHSDLSFMSGLYPWPVPAVCGHEGAGIVADSEPKTEWIETCAKSRGMLLALRVSEDTGGPRARTS